MSVSEIQLFNILKEKLGDKEAQSLVEYVESKVDISLEKRTLDLATKSDVRAEVYGAKSDLIKWMFIFWVGQLAAVVAIIKFLM